VAESRRMAKNVPQIQFFDFIDFSLFWPGDKISLQLKQECAARIYHKIIRKSIGFKYVFKYDLQGSSGRVPESVADVNIKTT
jgi:hypothetical protein